MKKIALYALIFTLLTGCKSFDPRMLTPTGTPFTPKLPAMEAYVENTLVAIVDANGNAIGASPQDATTYFEREVDDLMSNPYGDKKGSITLKVTNIETRITGVGFLELNAFTLFIPFFFGVPTTGALSSVEVEITVNNSRDDLLGKYSGVGREKFYSSLYNGKLYRDDVRIAYLAAVKIAIDDAKSKMANDIGRLNDELNKQ